MPTWTEMQQELDLLRVLKNAAVQQQDYERAAALRSREKLLLEEIGIMEREHGKPSAEDQGNEDDATAE